MISSGHMPTGPNDLLRHMPTGPNDLLRHVPTGPNDLLRHMPTGLNDLLRHMPTGLIVLVRHVPTGLNDLLRHMPTGLIVLVRHVRTGLNDLCATENVKVRNMEFLYETSLWLTIFHHLQPSLYLHNIPYIPWLWKYPYLQTHDVFCRDLSPLVDGARTPTWHSFASGGLFQFFSTGGDSNMPMWLMWVWVNVGYPNTNAMLNIKPYWTHHQ